VDPRDQPSGVALVLGKVFAVVAIALLVAGLLFAAGFLGHIAHDLIVWGWNSVR